MLAGGIIWLAGSVPLALFLSALAKRLKQKDGSAATDAPAVIPGAGSQFTPVLEDQSAFHGDNNA